MNKPIFKYQNIHTYLEENLKNVSNPSTELIVQLKKEYWRLYNTHFKKLKRFEQKEITTYFTKKELKEIQQNIPDKISLPRFVHDIVIATLQKGNIFITKHDPKLEQLLFSILDNLQDILETEAPIIQAKLQKLITGIENLQKHFEL